MNELSLFTEDTVRQLGLLWRVAEASPFHLIQAVNVVDATFCQQFATLGILKRYQNIHMEGWSFTKLGRQMGLEASKVL